MVNLNLIYVKGHSDYVLRLEIIKKAIAFSILAVTLCFDLTVICIGRVVYSVIAFYLNTYYTKKLLNYGFLTQIKELTPILLMSLVVCAMGMGISALIDNAVAALTVSLVACPVAYVMMCRVFKVEAFIELTDIVKSKLNGFKKH